MKEIILKYLEEQCHNDPALAEKFDERKMDDCISYIMQQARKALNGKNGAVEDTTVYSWAVHFFVEGLTVTDEKDDEEAAEIKESVKAAKALPEKKEKADDMKPCTEQLDLFAAV